ncbi:MAG: caspase family protein [Desulfovibrio sp.]|jgi:hypothetical protein
MHRCAFFAVMLCIVALMGQPHTAQAAGENRTALVIGNSAYKSAPLKNPANDARDMAQALKALGFDVTLLVDANHQKMESAVRDFGLALRKGGVGLFYFAGHGLQVGGENYLVPVDAAIQSESDVKYGCLNAGLVLGKMEDAGNGLNLIILDACRNNPFSRGFRSAEQGLAKMDAPTGSLIAYATAPGSVAADGQGRNGLYTEHLLRNLRTPGLPVTDLFMRVRMGVVAATGKKQVPWEASSLTGYFYFSGAGGPGQPPADEALAAQNVPVQNVPAQSVDLKTEKKRLAEEAQRIKREKQELAELQALQAERQRVEAEREKLAQAKQLALASRPKQQPASPPMSQAGGHTAQFAQLARAGFSEAQTYFEHAVRARPDDADARAGLAIALAFNMRLDDAAYHAQRLSEAGAQTPHARLARGFVLGLKGSADASYQLNRAAEDGADKALVLLCRGALALHKDEINEGKRFMEEYGALVPEGQHSPLAKALLERLNPVNRMVGKYYWGTDGNIGSTYLILERSGDGLKGTDGGGQYPSTITVTSIQGARLSFRMAYDLGFLLGGAGASDCVADFSQDMNRVPVTCRDAKYGAMSSYLFREQRRKP